MKLRTISAKEALATSKNGLLSILDVRAPVEFAKAQIPGSFNSPILTDSERHQVGLCYKMQGQPAAIALGHQMVDPLRPARVQAWKTHLKHQARPILTCWRGGLRSELAQAWLHEAGFEAEKVEGGYKALRAELLQFLEAPYSGFVLAGPTGSGKTQFLRSLNSPNLIDLESLAGHRGSTFGGLFLPEQPAQQTFENALAMSLRQAGPNLLIEDESRLVGRCVVPDDFFAQMKAMPRVVLEVPMAERLSCLKAEYVEGPLLKVAPRQVREGLVASLRQLKNRLGGAGTKELEDLLNGAFAGTNSHEAWITQLLERYYDPMYAYSLARVNAPVAFRGDHQAVREYLAR